MIQAERGAKAGGIGSFFGTEKIDNPDAVPVSFEYASFRTSGASKT
jgi:hypothetical protein